MKVMLAYVEEFTSIDLERHATQLIKKEFPDAIIDKIDYSKCIEIPFENSYDAIVILGQGRFVPPVAFKRILRKEEVKKIPVYVPATHVDYPSDVLHWHLDKNFYQPGLCKLESLSNKDLDKMYVSGMFPCMTI